MPAPGVDGGNTRPGARRCLLEVVPSRGGSVVVDPVAGVAIASLELSGDPDQPDRSIIHDWVRRGS
jgi:hypothetical protein